MKQQDKLFLLGDYVNRGPDSQGVMDKVMKWVEAGYDVTCLRGNHEDRVLHGVATGALELDEKYVNFINSLKIHHEEEQYIMVHAGLNFEEEDPMKDEHAMRWIRNWELRTNEDWLDGRKVLYGHNRKDRDVIEYFVETNKPYICIDNGCFMNDMQPGQGSLVAMELGSEKLTFQPNIDMESGTKEEDWDYLMDYVRI